MTQLQDAPVVPVRTRAAVRRQPQGSGQVTQIRSLFISDVHLGSKHSQAEDLLELLERYEPRYLYIVGDFIDGWKLKAKWRWLPVYDRILQRLLELKKAGTRIMYAPGNHDAFLRGFLQNFGVVELRDTFVHTTATGKRFLVLHGDQFDRVEQNHQWLSLIATFAYDLLLSANWWVNTLRGKKHDRYAFCGIVKRRVKLLVRHVSDFEDKLIETARESHCDGIVCGHVHAPRIMELAELAYCNTGDWVENCTALMEMVDGTIELVRHDGQVLGRLTADPAEVEGPLRVELPKPRKRRRRRVLAR